MTATIRPIKCPHGGGLLGEGATVAIYTDGCRATSGIPVRFWCGRDEMSKPNGVSITAGEYLRDWAEAEGINLDAVYRRWLKESKAREDAANLEAAHAEALEMNAYSEVVKAGAYRHWVIERAHAEALILNAGDELYDGAEHIDYFRTVEANDHAEYQRFMGAYESSAVQNAIKEHSDYLGEAPWTDRVDD